MTSKSSFWNVTGDGSKVGVYFVLDSGVGYATRKNLKSGLYEAKRGANRIVEDLERSGFISWMNPIEDVYVIGRNVGFRATRWFEVPHEVDGDSVMKSLGISKSKIGSAVQDVLVVARELVE